MFSPQAILNGCTMCLDDWQVFRFPTPANYEKCTGSGGAARLACEHSLVMQVVKLFVWVHTGEQMLGSKDYTLHRGDFVLLAHRFLKTGCSIHMFVWLNKCSRMSRAISSR